MRQVIHDIRTGVVSLADIPGPFVRPGHLRIATRASLISSGTERMLVEFGRASWIEKAQQQPEKVRQVLAKIRTDGLHTTLAAVRSKLREPMPLGYSNVGVVRDVGKGVGEFRVGDRVVSNGPHAEVVVASAHLCEKIPETVDDVSASFTVTAAIALQGIRLLRLPSGASVAVLGLGLIGLQAVQILRAYGASVVGFDPDRTRVALAQEFGVHAYTLDEGTDPVYLARAFAGGHGVHAVLVTASTPSNTPMHQAAQMCRVHGKVVLVGVVGLHLNRDDFYKNEISFQVSSAYGSDRYAARLGRAEVSGGSEQYWTVQQNFREALRLMGEGLLRVTPLVSAVHPFTDAVRAYDALLHQRGVLGIVLDYRNSGGDRGQEIVQLCASAVVHGSTVTIGFIGAGNFARRTLIPAFQASGARLKTIVSSGGLSGVLAGTTYGFERAGSDAQAMLRDREITAVVVSTPHSTHAQFVIDALRAGKHVFVEKPLCLTAEELAMVQDAYEREAVPRQLILMVGFNRRFAPFVQRLRDALGQTVGPKSVIITVNAGAVPSEHWTQDPDVGGGRIIGEACHFIDLTRYLVDAPIERVEAMRVESHDARWMRPDTTTIALRFADGSVGTVHYFANGSRRFPKERIEVFCGGGTYQIENFRKLHAYRAGRLSTTRRWQQDKGHRACADAFVRAVREGEPSPIPFAEIVEVTRTTLAAAGI